MTTPSARDMIGQFIKGGIDALKGGSVPSDSEPVTISIPEVIEMLQEQLKGEDREKPVLTALLLACILARQEGWTSARAAQQCLITWGQTAFVRPLDTVVGNGG